MTTPTPSGRAETAQRETCETCRFWKRGILKDGLTGAPIGLGDHGICRRSPAIYLHDEGWFQPCMMQDDWCGEYQARDSGNAD